MRRSTPQFDYWNRIGPGKTFSHPVNLPRVTEFVSRESRILDFGCGYGRVAGVLREQGFTNLVGVDPADAMVSAARERHPGITFETLRDPDRLPFADASFDAALLFAVLTCVPANHDQRALVDELQRVLRPGALLYISDFWLQTDSRNTERYARGYEQYGLYGVFDLPDGVTVRHHDRQWIAELMSGFETAMVDDIWVETMNGHFAAGFQWFLRKKGSPFVEPK